MNMARFRQPALSALAVLLISGAGIAFAGNPTSSPAQAQTAPAVEPVEPAGADTDTLQAGDQTTPDSPTEQAAEKAAIALAGNPTSSPAQAQTAPAVEPVEPAGADTDTLQAGDQTTPDSPTEQAAEKAGTETEKAGVEEPGDAGLPGGGHADDPNDPNADHQFEGVE